MLEAIAAIVREAGDVILSAGDIAAKTHEKTSAADLVTDYDVAVETLLREKLLALLPEAVFYGEEEETAPDPTRGWAFIVDPIDGTTNFVRHLRQSAVSVALARDGQVEFKTDNAALFDFSLEQAEPAGWKRIASTWDLHHDEILNAGNIMTEYEQKFSAQGNPICKMILSR